VLRLLGWVGLGVVLIGCSSFEPVGDSLMQAPPEYRAWFAKTQACSGLTGDFDRIQWYSVAGNGFDCPSGKCVGRWNSDHKIYIASAYASNEMVVRHEILHDLIGHPGHPAPPFGDPCPLTWESWRAAHGDSATTASPATGRLVRAAFPQID
jgi:hypothetical protein